ncbi:MAG: amidohydrolase family protein [Spirochaetales bacterium]|nr:amidohydrolase family protein [Spirochaetales bacterium]
MIIDFHAHIYPDKIAAKASAAIGEFYDAPMAWHGTVEELIASGDKIGVDKYVVLSAATKVEQVEPINNYILGEVAKQPKFIGFGTILPGYTDFENEMKRIRAAGLRGIKIHPDFQKFQIDSSAMDPVYEVLSDLGMPILVHAGDCRYDFSGPKRIANVLDKHPKLKLIAAHFGGYTEWGAATEYLVGRRVWFDTSSTFWKLPMADAKTMMRKHGVDKFLFGSDFPMWDHADEWSRFVQLGLQGDDLDAVLYKNALSLLGLSE